MKQLEKSDIDRLTAYTDDALTIVDCEIKLFPLLMRETLSNELKFND